MDLEGKQALINYLREPNSHTTLKLLDLFSYDELKGFGISALVLDDLLDVSTLYAYIDADSRLLRLFPAWVKTRYNIHNSVSVDGEGIDSYLYTLYRSQADDYYDYDYYYYDFYDDDYYDYYEHYYEDESDYMDLIVSKGSRYKASRGIFKRVYMSVSGYRFW